MESFGQVLLYLIIALVVIVGIVAVIRAVRIVPQSVALVVERLGRYSKTLDPGLHVLVPFVDRVRAGVDLREQVVSFPPQPVITSDNLVVEIDTVIYFQVTDAKSAVYEIANYITAIEQLTVTTLRNVIGSMDLEQTLTSRDQINGQLRGVLDEATGRWGIRVNRVELKSIEPPPSIQGAMEQQMRAERDRRAAILTAEGIKQSAILTAEGEKQSAILTAEGDAQSQILRAEGESRAIIQVFEAIHRGNADPKLLAYQYLQMLPQIANGTSNTTWVIPTEFTAALGSIAQGFGGTPGTPGIPTPPSDNGPSDGPRPTASVLDKPLLQDPSEALAEAQRQAEAAVADATSAGTRSGDPFDPSHERGQRPAGGTTPSRPTPPPPVPPAPPAPPAG
ncbi:SPFH domain-containing protein [Promicromonospora sp. CA-289599]|uniref:SPFH domain-containing protein n=1 Tax=Promicromonospora sp. CA-289599 TaxID=3240014 RepID=UPI003D92109F